MNLIDVCDRKLWCKKCKKKTQQLADYCSMRTFEGVVFALYSCGCCGSRRRYVMGRLELLLPLIRSAKN